MTFKYIKVEKNKFISETYNVKGNIELEKTFQLTRIADLLEAISLSLEEINERGRR